MMSVARESLGLHGSRFPFQNWRPHNLPDFEKDGSSESSSNQAHDKSFLRLSDSRGNVRLMWAGFK
jgi:hypothetical protein